MPSKKIVSSQMGTNSVMMITSMKTIY